METKKVTAKQIEIGDTLINREGMQLVVGRIDIQHRHKGIITYLFFTADNFYIGYAGGAKKIEKII